MAALLNTGRAGGAASGYVLRDATQTFITGLGYTAGTPDEKKRVTTHACSCCCLQFRHSGNALHVGGPKTPFCKGPSVPCTCAACVVSGAASQPCMSRHTRR